MVTKNAALDLGEFGVRVNAIAPGIVNTPMSIRTGHGTEFVINKWLEKTPLGRIGQPADIASAALFLASDEASWITGETLFVDGGLTLTAYPDLRDVT
jgi:3-oxoacyl-[acyl-carrier protein] reductase